MSDLDEWLKEKINVERRDRTREQEINEGLGKLFLERQELLKRLREIEVHIFGTQLQATNGRLNHKRAREATK